MTSDQVNKTESAKTVTEEISHIFQQRTAEMRARVSEDLFALETRIGRQGVIAALVDTLIVKALDDVR